MVGRVKRSDILDAALRLSRRYGIFPVTCGGTYDKHPAYIVKDTFTNYRIASPTEAEVREWWGGEDMYGIGLHCGQQGVICFDFDDACTFEPWCDVVRDHGGASVIERLVVVKTRHGFHAWARCPGHVGGGTDLAMWPEKRWSEERKKHVQVRIETRGVGQYAILPPSPGYVLLRGDLLDIPEITAEDLELLLGAASTFDERPPAPEPKPKGRPPKHDGGERPGDWFNRTADWRELIERAGGKFFRDNGHRMSFTRPGKRFGVSCTTGNGRSGQDLAKMHTSNWPPFEYNAAYSKHAWLAQMEFGGDFSAATKAIAQMPGYLASQPKGRNRRTRPQTPRADMPDDAEDHPMARNQRGSVPDPTPPAGEYELRTRSYNFTDLGNAQRLVAMFGDDMRYCHTWKRWLTWDGKRWLTDETGGAPVSRMAQEVIRMMYAEASQMEDRDSRKDLVAWARKCESRSRIDNMIALAQTQLGVAITPADLDTDPWLLNVLNGTLDLRTGKLRAPDRRDLLTRMVPVEFDPKAECPNWIRFLTRAMDGDGEMIGFIQKAVGYTLTGETREHTMFFSYGQGKNGKSTFTETMAALFADYGRRVPTETLMVRQNEGISNDVARLKGARFVSAAETEEGKRLNESKLKDLTGGDTIVARFMHAEFFEFKPTFKIWMYGNHKPIIRGVDEGIWRRIHMIPFVVTIPPEERDGELPAKLLRELPGILAWAVRGCLCWQRDGLQKPKAMEEAVQEYREEMDVIGSFLEECTVRTPGQHTTPRALYQEYVRWAKVTGAHEGSENGFSRQLKSRGMNAEKANGARVYRHLSLKSSQEMQPSVFRGGE
jgi:P4 family phage/plasmid primase-like protien